MWQQSVTPSIRGRLEERNDICVMQFSTKTAQGVIIFYMTEAGGQQSWASLRRHWLMCDISRFWRMLGTGLVRLGPITTRGWGVCARKSSTSGTEL